MTTSFDVVAVIGSLRRESLTRRVVGALTAWIGRLGHLDH